MTTPSNDSDLRRILDDAVSDVHPEGGLGSIRARAGRPSTRRWLPVTIATAAATVLVIGGGTWLAQQQSASPPVAGPGAPQTQQGQDPAEPTRTVDTTVYFVGNAAGGQRLFPELRHVTDATADDLQVAVDEVLTGQPRDPDYRSAWPVEGTTADATSDRRLITIDLSIPAEGWTSPDQAAGEHALQALVWSADEATKSDLPVRLLVKGRSTQQLFGVDVSQPLTKASADSTLAPVLISSPAEGATVPTQFTVEGRAATFEANVVWELKRGDQTVRHGFTTAQECCTLSPYSFTVTAPPGDYTLVVHDIDESGGEGVGTSQDTKDITVE